MELIYTIEERRICWPKPDATCLHGGCMWCDYEPFRKLFTIERYASRAGVLPHRGNGEQDAMAAYEYGLRNQFFNRETRTSRENLLAYGETVGVEALKKMAEGMPDGTHGRKKADVLAWLMRYRRSVLDESFRRTWNASQVIKTAEVRR
jgi:hypothetical protein